MLPDRVSNPGPLTYEPGAQPIALCGPAAERRRRGEGLQSGFLQIWLNSISVTSVILFLILQIFESYQMFIAILDIFVTK